MEIMAMSRKSGMRYMVVTHYYMPLDYLASWPASARHGFWAKSQNELGAHDPLCTSPSAGLLPKASRLWQMPMQLQASFRAPSCPTINGTRVSSFLRSYWCHVQGSLHLGISGHARELPITTSAAGGEC